MVLQGLRMGCRLPDLELTGVGVSGLGCYTKETAIRGHRKGASTFRDTQVMHCLEFTLHGMRRSLGGVCFGV